MKKYLIEAIGAFFWVFLLVLADVAGNRDWTPLVLGAGVGAFTLAAAGFSGAHFNPAISIAVWMRSGITKIEAPYYVLAQVLAAVLASWIAVFLLRCQGFTEMPVLRGDPVCSLVAEGFGSFALTFVFLQVRREAGNAGWAVGLALMGISAALRPISGGVLNPAAALGLAMSDMLNVSDLWVYIAGPLLGAAAAASLHQGLHQTPETRLPDIPDNQD